MPGEGNDCVMGLELSVCRINVGEGNEVRGCVLPNFSAAEWLD